MIKNIFFGDNKNWYFLFDVNSNALDKKVSLWFYFRLKIESRKNPKCYISVGSNKYLIQDLKEAVVLQFGAQSFWREEAGARNAKLRCLGGCGFDAECKTLSVEQILGKRRNRAGNANCSWEPKNKIKYFQFEFLNKIVGFWSFLDQNICLGWYLT